MSEPLLAHQVVGLYRSINVVFMYSYRHSHQHVLWPLHLLVVHFQQIRSFQGLETEVVILVVTFEVDGCL